MSRSLATSALQASPLRSAPTRPPASLAGGVRPPSDPKDTVELTPLPAGSPAPPSAAPRGPDERSWTVGLRATLQQLPGPIAVPLTAVLDVWSGNERDSLFEQTRDFPDGQQARAQFERSQARLLNPNQWESLGPRLAAAKFQLYSRERAEKKDGPPGVGDYLRIRLPDLGPRVWCRIERLEQDADSIDLVVRPSRNPLKEEDGDVAHFFAEKTTNHFQLRREGNRLIARVVGRDEALNETGNGAERLLSALRLKGAWMGAKNPQWKSFTRKLLED